MSAPHPALFRVIASIETGPIEDEEAFLVSCAEHRMIGATITAIESGAFNCSSEAAMKLAVSELAEASRHRAFWGTIALMTETLDQLGVEIGILKGVATESRWYERMGQRVCTDIDVFLSPDAAHIAASVVRHLDRNRGSDSSIDFLAKRGLLQHVDLKVGNAQIDLHLDPLKLGIPTKQITEVWGSMETLEVPCGTIRVLRSEIELVLLLLHLNKDGFSFLGTFLDIPRIVAGSAFDWGYFEAFVSSEGLDVPVWKSLKYVMNTLGFDQETPDLSGARSLMWDRIWSDRSMLRGYEGRQDSPGRQRFLPLHARGRFREILSELRRQGLPPRELVDVAGRLDDRKSYIRYLTIDRFRDL
jgi:hypothetical protein